MRRRKLCNEIFERILSDAVIRNVWNFKQQTSLHGILPKYEIYHAYNLDIKNIFSKRIEFDVKNCFCFD